MITEVINGNTYLPNAFESLRSLEPWWKLVVSSKAMLPLLYDKYPNNPYLLPSYFSGE